MTVLITAPFHVIHLSNILQSLIPARLLEPFRTKRKVLYQQPDPEMLKLPDNDLIQNSPDNYVVTPHRKRRPGFHNSPSQNPPFVPYSPSYIEDLRSRKGPPSSSAPPSYFPGTYCIIYTNECSPIEDKFKF